jgi:hypothetical protein
VDNETIPQQGVESDLRRSYQSTFFGSPTKSEARRVFCDLLAQTNIFSAFAGEGLTPEAGEAKREIGLYLLAMVGMAPSDTADIFSSMDSLVRMFAKNNKAAKAAAAVKHGGEDE